MNTKQSWFKEQGIELPDLGHRPFIPEGKEQTIKVAAVRQGKPKQLPDGNTINVLLVVECTVEGRAEQIHEWEVTSKLAAARLAKLLHDGPCKLVVKKTGTGTNTAYHIEKA